MNAFPKIDMALATRLTREGKFGEAMAVLRGKSPSAAAQPEDNTSLSVLDMVQENGSWTTGDSPLTTKDALNFARTMQGFMGQFGTTTGTAQLPLPVGAKFEETEYASLLGPRRYKLYVPSRYDGKPLPLVVMLHGCTQSPDDFAAGTRMNELGEEQGFLVAYPAQPQSANSSRCWNWFNVADQRRDQGEPALIAGITRQIMRDFAVAPGCVYVAGLSAGGAAAATMGSTYPELYAAIGVHSGLVCGAASDMPSAFAAMKNGASAAPKPGSVVPTIVFHGDQDVTVNAINGNQIIAQYKATEGLRTTVTAGKAAGGIAYTQTVQADQTGRPILEQWVLHGAGHAWAGGSQAGSFTDPRGPDASREMVRFFFQQPIHHNDR